MKQRSRIKHILPLEERLAEDAKQLREEAKKLPPAQDEKSCYEKLGKTILGLT
jgi:hypothetical protein